MPKAKKNNSKPHMGDRLKHPGMGYLCGARYQTIIEGVRGRSRRTQFCIVKSSEHEGRGHLTRDIFTGMRIHFEKEVLIEKW